MLYRYNLERIKINKKITKSISVWIIKDNKIFYKSFKSFIDFLWDYNDRKERRYWDNKGYQTLYQRSITMIRKLLSGDVECKFKRNLKEIFILNN